MLDHLRAKNPRLPLFEVSSPEFAPYGRLLGGQDCSQLTAEMESLSIPLSGNCYVASDSRLESLSQAAMIKRQVFGDMDIQCGYCNGRGYTLNALEYHKCSEVNYTSTGLVLLLALPEDMEQGRLDSGKVKGFYLPPGTLVEIYPHVLHFAPCRVVPEGFNCLVVLERGVNSPLESRDREASGEEALLWFKGKWMICHPDSPQAEKGAFPAITGENIQVHIQ